jgi:hypothetical protein
MDLESNFRQIAANNHSDSIREENDFYATHPKAAKFLLELEEFDLNIPIWECACGKGHLSRIFDINNYMVISTDLYNQGLYKELKQPIITNINFLTHTYPPNFKDWKFNIVTNPPYIFAKDFIEHGIKILPAGCKMCYFLKLVFMESKGRKEMFTNIARPSRIWVSSSRIICSKNGLFREVGSAVVYAWYIWEKDINSNIIHSENGKTEIDWFN